jgi:hypothetical protein
VTKVKKMEALSDLSQGESDGYLTCCTRLGSHATHYSTHVQRGRSPNYPPLVVGVLLSVVLRSGVENCRRAR